VAKGGTGAITASDARDNLGLGSIATQDDNSVAITGGTATLSSATLSTADINGGTIDNTTVGATTPSSGRFTTLSASSGYTGTVQGNVTGDVTGNSTTATRLQTARTIAGQSFDGTANIAIAPTDLTGVTATAAEINKLDGYTGTATHLNYAKDLYNTGVTSTEFDYLDGVSSNIQSQLGTKANLSGASFTGNVSSTGTVSAGTISGTNVNATNIDFSGSFKEDGTVLTATYSSNTSGYVKLMNGLKINWGWVARTGGTQTVSYASSYSTRVYAIQVTPTRASSGVSMDAPYINSGYGTSLNQFTFYWSGEGNGMFYVAIGK